MGLLYDFLGTNDARAPLYGRYFHEIKLNRFSHSESVAFLTKGFEQVNMEVQREVIEYAVERLDGVVGWLVNFGWKSVQTGEATTKSVDEVLEEAGELALDEFKSFLEKHAPADRRLAEVAKAIASGKNRWSDIKRALERSERREIPDMSLSRLLNTLLKATYIEKTVEGRNVQYRIVDPVLEHALRREDFHA
ncbi:AAA family ATPase [Archaeoglobus neptunius]|uniref:AAA family ATPase n=1 Tax=Archaeoglobus neptunius TaxID=2798580 RepID=UPI00192889B8|nr:ATP-binding protein [Archaeoglobus neptunius]